MTETPDIIQVAERPWEAWYPEYPGTKCKTIFDDASTGESLKLAFVPSGFQLAEHTRHHHGTTREFVYVLFGDLPYVEYEEPSAAARGFTFAEGMLLDRPPRSIHGMSVDPVSSLGALVLEWTTGPNVFHRVPFDDTSAFDGEPPWGQPWVADQSQLAWAEHPAVQGWHVKVMSPGQPEPVPGFHPVALVHVPGAWSPTGGVADLPLGGTGAPWCYVLSGTGAATLAWGDRRSPVDLAPGTWLRWGDGARIELDEDWTGDVGLTLLCAGSLLVDADE